MPIFQTALPIGIGDIIMAKAALDGVREQYDEIHLTLDWELLKARSMQHRPFLEAFMATLFGAAPYRLCFNQKFTTRNIHDFAGMGIRACHPRLAHLLCNNASPPVGGAYLVLQTKVRDFGPDMYKMVLRKDFRRIMRDLSSRYKLVLLGEREIQYNKEYAYHGTAHIYSMYEEFTSELPVVDMTLPKLGIDSPRLGMLRRDCAIMHNAERCIIMGHGGGPCLALACGRVIGMRTDPHPALDTLYPHHGEQPSSVQMFYDNDSNDWLSSKPARRFLDALEALG